MEKKRKRWTGEEIVELLRKYHVEKVELSKVCEEYGCAPSQVYKWQQQLYDGGANLFQRGKREEKAVSKVEEKAKDLEAQLQRKNEVLARLMEAHVLLKKVLGKPKTKVGAS